MPKKLERRSTEIDRLAQTLAKLVMVFRRGGPARDFKWWHGQSDRTAFLPLHGYTDGAALYEEVVKGMLELNGEMLSEYGIWERLAYPFLQMQTISSREPNHLDGQSLINEAKKHLTELTEFQVWRDIGCLIGNLRLAGEPVKIGRATLTATTREDVAELWDRLGLRPESTPDVGVVARVTAPGDYGKTLLYARNCTNEALDILRAFCFPFGRHSDTWLVGVVGDIVSATSNLTPFVISGQHPVAQLGGGIAQLELRQVIQSKLEQPQLEQINRLVLKTDRSEMEQKLLASIYWLGESTKPDIESAKFAKISFALETLVGGEPKEEERLQVRGITAMLAERSAFVAGVSIDDRLSIDAAVRRYYGKRSDIVHGRVLNISLDDIDGFGELVRRLVHSLLQMVELGSEINDVTKLETWVKRQKYTLPNDSRKRVT